MKVAEYWASLGFKIDQKELRKVDSTLKQLEAKLAKFGKKIGKSLLLDIKIDQKKLNTSLGNALDRASNSLVFEISRFSVNQRNMQAALMRASRSSGGALANDRTAMLNYLQGRNGGIGSNTYITQTRSLSPDEWNRRERTKNEEWNRRRAEIRADEEARRAARGVRRGGLDSGTVVGAGGVGGLAARAYMPALALAGGGYGAGWLNRRNQDVVSAQLMTQAVVQQAGGTTEQGMQSFDWLRQQGERVGFNYLDAAPDFNKLISGLTGAGMSVDTSQETFKGFAELSRVNKLDKTSQNRLFRALSQVAGKNQLMSEELTGQIAEALPGGVALFAEAYQRQTGGNLKGSESISALREAMKNKAVKGDILPVAAQIASEKASSGLSAASKASQAEQARAQNALNDRAITASNAGVEQGFARLFKTFAITLQESGPLVEKMAQGFNSMSLYASNALLSIQSITRFFQGRDSLLGDKLFPDEESQAKAFVFLEQFKNFMSEMDKLTMNIYNGWSMLLDKLSSSKILDTFNTSLSIMSNTAATFNKLAEGDFSGAADAASGAGKKYVNSITAPGRSGANALLSTFTDRRIPTPFSDADSQLDWQANYRAEQARMAAASKNQYALPGVNQPLNGMQSTNLEIKMDVNISAANPEDFNTQFQDKFKSVIESTMMQYSQKE
jgi:hypothetical protein